MANKIKVGITQGDAAGVGWEVILKTLAEGRMAELASFVVYGSPAAAELYKNLTKESAGVQIHTVTSARQWAGQGGDGRALTLVNTDAGAKAFTVEPGQPTAESGAAAVRALRSAVADLREGVIDVLVTAPISKEHARSEEFDFAGHTEFLGKEFGATPVMMMCSDAMRVALVTAHMALADVPGAISKAKIVEKLRTLRHSLIADFGIVEPRIAVLALNPHAGENGLMGTDEEEVIRPAIEAARAEGILAFGPMAGDGIFLAGEFARYDALLAMYHDQGLAPFKTLSPDGVNFTAGLPVVRTSPDHGTAFDIAGKDAADPASMRNAIYTAIDIHRHRAAWAEMTRNPLKHYEREKGADITIDFSKSEI